MGGSSGEGKSEKSHTPPQDQTSLVHQPNFQVYPDWTTMQACYGPRVTVPPYYNSAVASGQAPHPYMWGPTQPMMSPYGAPYAAIYSHGSVYAHPAVTLVGLLSPPPISLGQNGVTPLNAETPKSLGNTNGGVDDGVEHRLSQSGETDASSDMNVGLASQSRRKRSRQGTPAPGKDEKSESRDTSIAATETNGASDKNERELKREKRKQSNRESARKSRLRKQSETEELAQKVESMVAENEAIRSEISRLTSDSEKLKQENATLLEKLKSKQTGGRIDKKRLQPKKAENLKSRVKIIHEENDLYLKRSNST